MTFLFVVYMILLIVLNQKGCSWKRQPTQDTSDKLLQLAPWVNSTHKLPKHLPQLKSWGSGYLVDGRILTKFDLVMILYTHRFLLVVCWLLDGPLIYIEACDQGCSLTCFTTPFVYCSPSSRLLLETGRRKHSIWGARHGEDRSGLYHNFTI